MRHLVLRDNRRRAEVRDENGVYVVRKLFRIIFGWFVTIKKYYFNNKEDAINFANNLYKRNGTDKK